jgi:hypothetical protein
MAQTFDAMDIIESSTQEFTGGGAYGGTHFDVYNTTGSGVGWRQGYSQFGLFTPLNFGDDWMIAPNGRLTITDSSRIGFSTGGILRKYMAGSDRILGFNAYYDSDESNNGFDYQQLGLGFESLGRFLDFRSNLYLPIRHEKNFVRAQGLGNTPYFAGNRVNFIGNGLFGEPSIKQLSDEKKPMDMKTESQSVYNLRKLSNKDD